MRQRIRARLFLICVMITGLLSSLAQADAMQICRIDFSGETEWKAEAGVGANTALDMDASGGNDIFCLERDTASGGDTKVLFPVAAVDVSLISRIKVSYKTMAEGWMQMQINLLNKDKQALVSTNWFGGDQNYVYESATYSLGEYDMVDSAAGKAVYVELTVRGFSAANSTVDACRKIYYDYIIVEGEEASAATKDEAGTHYTFDSNSKADGWDFQNGFTVAGIQDGVLEASVNTGGAAMVTQADDLDITAAEHSNIVLKFRNKTASEIAKVYFRNNRMQGFSEAACFTVETVPDSSTVDTYVINTIENESWMGRITALKIIPADAEGTVFWDEIGILRYPFTVTDQAEGIRVEGCDPAFADKAIGLQVLRSGYTLAGLAQGDPREAVLWEDEQTASADGAFSFAFSLPEAEICDQYIFSIASDFVQYDWEAEHRNPDFEQVFWDRINQYSAEKDVNGLRELLDQNQAYLTETDRQYAEFIRQGGACGMVAESLAEMGGSQEGTEIQANLNIAAVLAVVNISDEPRAAVEQYSGVLGLKALPAYQTYTELNPENQGLAMQRTQAKKSRTVSQMQNAYSEACILTALEKNMGYAAIKRCLQTNQELLKIDFTECDRLKNPDNVYRLLAGKAYASLDAVRQAFDLAVQKQKDAEKNSHNSTGGSGGGGNQGAITSVAQPQPEQNMNPQQQEVFSDLAGTEWAKENILRLHAKGVIAGKGEGLFCPGDPVTREEFVKILVCAMGIEQDRTDRFSDVGDAWYAPYIGGAVRQGIVSGLEEDRFGVGVKISRQDMCTMICRAAGIQANAQSAVEYADKTEIASYALESVQALSAAGIVSGMEHGYFMPGLSATRAQAAVLVDRLLIYLEK